MTGPVRSHTEAVAAVGRALAAYETQTGVAADAALNAARRIAADAAAAQAERQRRLARAEQDLRSCRADPKAQCRAEEARVGRARESVEVARKAAAIADRAVRDLAASRSRFLAEIAALVGPGRALTSVKVSDLEAYLNSLGGSAVASPVANSSSVGVRTGSGAVAGLPVGYELVPMDLIDVRDPVTGRDEFGKGYSPEDLGWAFTAFDEVVLPALIDGHGQDYFTSRDGEEGRMGTRSYSDTYSGFLTECNAIVLDALPGGRYELSENGRHRYWVAQQRGRQTIPARVRR